MRQIMGAWDFLAPYAGKKTPCHKVAHLGGDIGLFFCGGGSANSILMGAGIFLKKVFSRSPPDLKITFKKCKSKRDA